MKKLMLLIAAGSLWLFLAAAPAFADGGPHVTAANSGTSTLTADSCAGCHRAHTAQGEYLINQPTEEQLCLGCHEGGTGATTDVMQGVQYTLRDGSAVIAGGLRGGGFDVARIGDPGRVDQGTNYKTKVVVDTTITAANDVTSAHIAMTENGLTNPHKMWGSGANNSGVGEASVTLSCASCHNPHGNGQYRILRPTPNAGAAAFEAYGVAKIDGTSDTIYTTSGHAFQVGDVVKFNSVTQLTGTSYVVVSVANGVQLQIGTLVAGGKYTVTDLTDAVAGGTVQRYQAVVTDAPLGTADGNGVYPTRNYTVMQTMGTQGTDATYMLYLSDVTTAAGAGTFNGIAGTYTAGGGDYWHRQVPWNAASNATAKSIVQIDVTTGLITTTAAHGLAVGNPVQVSNIPGVLNTTFVVATVPSTTTLTLTGFVAPASTLVFAPGSQPGITKALSMDDAPNGQPYTNPGSSVGDVAFNIQITAWCTSCHTRYYANQNANPTGTDAGSSAASSKNVIDVTAAAVLTTVGTHGLNIGDTVAIAGIAGITDGSYTVATTPNAYAFSLVEDTSATANAATNITAIDTLGNVTSTLAASLIAGDYVNVAGASDGGLANGRYVVATSNGVDTFTVTNPGATYVLKTWTSLYPVAIESGTAIRTSAPQAQSSWWFPRNVAGTEDSTYKFQHRTIPNRACTTCHVAHGSNVDMTGFYSGSYTRPDGVVSSSSRMLKIDNRGTCQGCHDPTSTWASANSTGTYIGASGGNVVP